MADLGRLTVTQYRDSITSERRTVTTCPKHTQRLLRVLRLAGVGCSPTWSPSLTCDPCKNEETDRGCDRYLILARTLAGCTEEDGDCAVHEPCDWPCMSKTVTRMAESLAAAEKRGRVEALQEAAWAADRLPRLWIARDWLRDRADAEEANRG